VRINLPSVADEAAAAEMRASHDERLARARQLARAAQSTVDDVLSRSSS